MQHSEEIRLEILRQRADSHPKKILPRIRIVVANIQSMIKCMTVLKRN